METINVTDGQYVDVYWWKYYGKLIINDKSLDTSTLYCEGI